MQIRKLRLRAGSCPSLSAKLPAGHPAGCPSPRCWDRAARLFYSGLGRWTADPGAAAPARVPWVAALLQAVPGASCGASAEREGSGKGDLARGVF